MGAAKIGFIMIALGFPFYLLWKGRLPAYLALASAASSSGTTTASTTTNPTPFTTPNAGTTPINPGTGIFTGPFGTVTP